MGGILTDVPIPIDDAIARPRRREFGREQDPLEGRITRPWTDYFTNQSATIQNASLRVGSVELAGQTASIGATDVTEGNLAAGLYRLTYYVRITTAGGAGHTLITTLDWQDLGVARSFSGASLNGTVLANNQSNSVLIYSDGASPVRYSTAVGAGVPPAMVYALSVILETVRS